jgi:hypothetical protein
MMTTTFRNFLKAFVIAAMKLTAVLTVPLFLSGCLTPKKLDKVVAGQYSAQMTQEPKKPREYLTITSGLPFEDDRVSMSESKTTNMLPLLFYWQWDYNNTCKINPRVPINNFKRTVYTYAEKELKKKLNGQRVELTIDEIPNTFVIVDKAHLVWIIYAISWDNVYITPVKEDMNMVVSYKILNGDTEIKKGTISVSSFDSKRNLGMFKSWKSATSEYLYQYEANITAVSKLVVDKLVEEL